VGQRLGGAGGGGGAPVLDDTPRSGGAGGGGLGGLAMIDERVHTLLTRRSSDSLRPVEDYVFHSGDVFTTDLAPPPLAATIFRL